MNMKFGSKKAKDDGRYDVGMIRDFLDQLKSDYQVMHHEHDQPGVVNHELVEQTGRFMSRRHNCGLVPLNEILVEGMDAKQNAVVKRCFHQAMKEVSERVLACLDGLDDAFEAAFECLRSEKLLTRQWPADVFMEALEGAGIDRTCSGDAAAGDTD